jgi:uncharacterized protein DUF1153
VPDAPTRKNVPSWIGLDGERITCVQLPRPGLKRWSPRDRALVVAAVQYGLLSFDEACKRYQPYAEEYLAWHERFGGIRRP